MRIINGTYWPLNVFGIKRRVEEILENMKRMDHAGMIARRAIFRGDTNLDLLDTSRMDFTPRQAKRMLYAFYLGRYGWRSAAYEDLARLTSIARGKGDPIAKWSEPLLPTATGRDNMDTVIEDWHVSAKWYRQNDDQARNLYK